jgi:hypothetical protein
MARGYLTVGKETSSKLLGAMLAIIKSSRTLRCFLLAAFVFSLTTAAFVFSLTTAADAADLHWAGAADSEHAAHATETAHTAAPDMSAQPPAEHDSNHENHCSMDALCITGAWTLTGHPSVVRPTARTSVAGLLPPDAPVKGLRPRPELRPPRHDS